MKEVKTLVVFGGGDYLANSNEYNIAYEVGKIAAENNMVVCTGGYYGVMEAASRGAYENNGRSLGILHCHPSKKAPNAYLSNSIIADDYLERLARLLRFSYSIALPGSSGTLAEITVAIALLNRYENRRFAIWEPFWNEKLKHLISTYGRQPDLINNLDSIAEWIQGIA